MNICNELNEKLLTVIPITLAIVFVLLYLTFSRVQDALVVMLTIPFALAGSLWYIWYLDYQLSVAIAVGMIALAGVAAEFGVVMLLYLNNALKNASRHDSLTSVIQSGAVQRVRPKAMTVITIIAGLLPIMWGSGTGNEVMQKIAAPMVGGMVLSPLISLFVIPVLFLLLNKKEQSDK